MSIEIIDVTPQQVELMTVVVGPPGPAGKNGQPGAISAQQIQDVIDDVESDLDDWPDLTLIVANALI